MTADEPSVVRDIRVAQGKDGAIVTVCLAGDVNLHHSHEARNELIRLAEERPKRMIVDLSGVDHLDSSGVATLVETLQHVRRNGGRMILVGPNQRVRSMFQVARLDTIFQIAATVEEAEAL